MAALLNQAWDITTVSGLVPDGTVYLFTDPWRLLMAKKKEMKPDDKAFEAIVNAAEAELGKLSGPDYVSVCERLGSLFRSKVDAYREEHAEDEE